jgi:hypothetical protein
MGLISVHGCRWGVVASLFWCMLAMRLVAQVPTNINPSQLGQPDTTKRTPSKLPKGVYRFSLNDWHLGLNTRDTMRMELDRVPRWNETDTLGGWLQSLGYPGKSYQRFQYGVNEAYLPTTSLYRDPLTSGTDVYVLRAETQMPLYNTRTPFFDLRYDQGLANIQFLDIKAGINITPRWNVAILYRTRNAGSAYKNFESKHNIFGFSTSYASRNSRYRMAFTLAYNVLEDNMNGGVKIDTLPRINNLYNKGDAATYTPSANLARRVLSFSLFQQWALHSIGWQQNPARKNDSLPVSLARLGGHPFEHFVYMGTTIDLQERRYQDNSDTTSLSSIYNLTNGFNQYRNYGLIYSGVPIKIHEFVATNAYQLYTGYRTHWERSKARWQGRLEYNLTYKEGSRLLSNITQLKHTVMAEMRLQPTADTLGRSASLRATFSANDLFAPEVLLEANGRYSFGYRQQTYLDTLYRKTLFLRRKPNPRLITFRYNPLTLEVQASWQSSNPSLMVSYWNGVTFRGENQQVNWGSYVRGGGTFRNEQTGIVRVQLQWRGGELALIKRVPVLHNFVRISPFISYQGDRIFFDKLSQPNQDGRGATWAGVELAGRVRFWRFYLQAEQTFQVSATSIAGYKLNQPNAFGKASLYFQGWLFKRAAEFYVGFEGHWFTQHTPLAFDASTQNWYPRLSQLTPAYIRLDAIIGIRLRTAIIYVRVQHWNEGLWQKGYWLTPFFPMQERQVLFGIRWKLFE